MSFCLIGHFEVIRCKVCNANITKMIFTIVLVHKQIENQILKSIYFCYYLLVFRQNEPKLVFLLLLYNLKGNAYMMQIYYFIFNVCLEDFSNTILTIINFVLRSQFLHMKNLL